MGPCDRWIAECSPCGWAQAFEDENAAIIAAEFHAIEYHRGTNSDQRGAEKIGHVQLRTIDANSAQLSFPPAPALMDAAPYVPAPATAGTVAPGNNVAELVAALIKMFIPAKE